MTSEERREVFRFIPSLWHSFTQAIVQSRLGEKTNTVSKIKIKRSSMFNIEMLLEDSITKQFKKFIEKKSPSLSNPYSLEILLHTAEPEQEDLVLEIWTLSIEENSESSSQSLCPVSDRISVLLKSAICVSRITPAYGLSFGQSENSYIIMYKIYSGKPPVKHLGENPTKFRVAQTNVHPYYLNLHLSYRTDMAIRTQSKNVVPDPIMVKSDHFKWDSSPKRQRRISERVTDSSDAGATSDESQDASRWPFMPPMDFQHSSPRSRTSSESSNRGLFSTLSSEKIYVPFANPRPPSLEEIFLQDEASENNILVSTIEKLENLEFEREKEREAKERRISETESEGKPAKASEKAQMSSSDHSNKSFVSNTTREDEYVVVDMKTPFADTSANDLELSTYYKEWKAAPPLKEFSMSESTNSDVISAQIEGFENFMSEYDELVKSFHVEDMSNSQEELG